MCLIITCTFYEVATPTICIALPNLFYMCQWIVHVCTIHVTHGVEAASMTDSQGVEREDLHV